MFSLVLSLLRRGYRYAEDQTNMYKIIVHEELAVT